MRTFFFFPPKSSLSHLDKFALPPSFFLFTLGAGRLNHVEIYMMEAMAAEFVDASLLLITRRLRKGERAFLAVRGTILFQIQTLGREERRTNRQNLPNSRQTPLPLADKSLSFTDENWSKWGG